MTSLEEMWLYSVRAWCSDIHTYFQPVLSASSTRAASFISARCSDSGSCAPGPGT